MYYSDRSESKLLSGEAVEIGIFTGRSFAREFEARNNLLLYKVTDGLLSMKCGVKGTHWATINMLSEGDIEYLITMLPAQRNGFIRYTTKVSDEISALNLEVMRRNKEKAE